MCVCQAHSGSCCSFFISRFAYYSCSIFRYADFECATNLTDYLCLSLKLTIEVVHFLFHVLYITFERATNPLVCYRCVSCHTHNNKAVVIFHFFVYITRVFTFFSNLDVISFFFWILNFAPFSSLNDLERRASFFDFFPKTDVCLGFIDFHI